jgi:hypothetical protein
VDIALTVVGLLPPLLYAAAIRTSPVEFHRIKRPTIMLSVGLVISNTVMIGLGRGRLPVPTPAALALGAVVAPSGAVAATTIARRLRLCMSGGRLGCCDSSVGSSVTVHWDEEHHPVIRLSEPGEAWRWCFADMRAG